MQTVVMILLAVMSLLLVAALGKQKRRLTELEEKLEGVLDVLRQAAERSNSATTVTVPVPTVDAKEGNANV